jgi:hypothetical protein
MSEFEAPSATGGIQWADLKGALLVIEPHKVEVDIPTTFGKKEAVRADVHVIDGPKAGESFGDTLIFPGVLIGQTRSMLGKKVLGRLGQGEGKAGQQPPWKLSEATPADQATAQAWLASRNSFAAPTAAGAPPF